MPSLGFVERTDIAAKEIAPTQLPGRELSGLFERIRVGVREARFGITESSGLAGDGAHLLGRSCLRSVGVGLLARP